MINYDLWENTRTDKLESVQDYKENKVIAADVRKHLRERFPMCKWSITSDTYNIWINLVKSPFREDSEELKAITKYAYDYANSKSSTYAYINPNIVSWDYEQSPITPEIKYISDKFQENKTAYEKEQEELMMKRVEKELEERKIQEAEYKKWQAEHEKVVKKIEDNVTVKDADFFAMHFMTTAINKLSSVAEYVEEYQNEVLSRHFKNSETYSKDLHIRYADCHISREIYMSKEIYDLFQNELLTDFSFLSNMGGSCTLDPRVKNDFDYSNMSPEERDTVKWFNVNCVAIYCEGDLKLVIDPQGHNYARYTLFPEADTKIVNVDDIQKMSSDLYAGSLTIEGYKHNFEYDAKTNNINIHSPYFPNPNQICDLAVRYAVEHLEDINKDEIANSEPEYDEEER